MSMRLHFPGTEEVKKAIFNQPVLGMDYYKEKGITQAIAKLSAERFADKDIEVKDIQMGVWLIIEDVKNGKDGFTGESIPGFKQIELLERVWNLLLFKSEVALKGCAKEV
ncbi:hypothetical protein N9Y92_02315 [Chlamydiales bacterium]|nr:hypothetical protein [Chlamydiales bacterium]